MISAGGQLTTIRDGEEKMVKFEHDIDRLEKGIRRFQEIAASLAREKDIEELIPIWRRPGYTTPAEFMLLVGTIDALINLTESAVSVKGLLIEASPAVSLEG